MSFQVDFKPVAKVGENLYVYAPTRAKVHGYYKIKYVEPLPEPQTLDFGSLASGAASGDTESTDLYMDDNAIAQYRMILLDDIEVAVAQPKAQGRFATKTVKSIISFLMGQDKPAEYLNLTEFFVFEDEKVFFNATNPTKYTSAMNRIRFIGWKYVVEKLDKIPDKSTFIPVESGGSAP